jgi:hypothetical protein
VPDPRGRLRGPLRGRGREAATSAAQVARRISPTFLGKIVQSREADPGDPAWRRRGSRCEAGRGLHAPGDRGDRGPLWINDCSRSRTLRVGVCPAYPYCSEAQARLREAPMSRRDPRSTGVVHGDSPRRSSRRTGPSRAVSATGRTRGHGLPIRPRGVVRDATAHAGDRVPGRSPRGPRARRDPDGGARRGAAVSAPCPGRA